MRQAKCKRCGIVFAAVGSQTYCETCRTEIKRESVLRPKTCMQCGVTFNGYPRSMYCPNCAVIRRRAKDVEYHRRGAARKIGSTDRCTVCGKEYTVTSGRQAYCPDCRDKSVRDNINAHKREYMAEHAAGKFAEKKARKADRCVCLICGNTFTTETNTVTCSAECADKLKKQWQKEADQKRAPRRRDKKS